MRQGVLWTNLSHREISRSLDQMATPASRHVVPKLLKKHGLGQRKAGYLGRCEPVISIDTKKKELIGNFAREGHTHTQAQVQTPDHDFPSAG